MADVKVVLIDVDPTTGENLTKIYKDVDQAFIDNNGVLNILRGDETIAQFPVDSYQYWEHAE